MRRRLLLALSLVASATFLHLSSCGGAGSGDGVADAMAGGDAVGAEPRVVDGSAPDSTRDASDASDAADACASCASGACGDGGCDPAVFVTSKEYAGAIGDGGVVAADQECAALAAAAGLPGTFRAWLSAAGQSSPSARFTNKSTRPYRRLDGTQVAADFGALASTLKSTISFTEKRVEIPFSYVWTATNGDGMATIGGGDCAGWTSADPAVKGGSGESDDTVSEWTAFGDTACSMMARLYCFEQPP